MAPEAIAGMVFDTSKLDIFALGAVAYYVFSGFAPASSIEELQRKCVDGRGLRISEVIDGAGQALQELIQFSTAPTVEDRLDSVRDFLELLEGVEDELTEPAPEDVAPSARGTGKRSIGARVCRQKAPGIGIDQHRPTGRARRQGRGAESTR